ncbi:MAG: hypothetical protein ACJAXK_000112 [Yoonia sp.]|jgi:hypothetical protein
MVVMYGSFCKIAFRFHTTRDIFLNRYGGRRTRGLPKRSIMLMVSHRADGAVGFQARIVTMTADNDETT